MNKIKLIKRLDSDYIAWLASWAVIFFIYLSTIAKYVTGYGDSDEILYASYLGTIAHPPGYPLLIWLLHYWFKLNIFNISIPALGHLMAVIFQAMTLSMLFIIIHNIWSKFLHRWEIVLIVWIIGLSKLFWVNATTIEVFALNNFLSLLVIYIGLKLNHVKRIHWLGLGLVWGIAITHHQLSIFLGGFVFYIWNKHRSFKMITPFISGLFTALGVYLGLLYLLALNAINQSVGWRLDLNFQSLINHLTRKDYSGVLIETGNYANAYWKGFSLQDSLQGLAYFWFQILPEQFGWLIWAILSISLIYVIINFKQNTKLLALMIPSLVLILYIPVKSQDSISQTMITTRMYLWSLITIGLLLPISWIIIKNKLSSKLKIVFNFIIFTALVIHSHVLFPKVSLNNWNSHYQSLLSTLAQVDRDSRVICFSDISCFGFIYLQTVEQIRPDIIILPITPQLKDRQLIADNHLSGRYRDNPFRVIEFLASGWKSNQQTIVTEYNPIYLDWLPNQRSIFLEPFTDYGLKISCILPESPTEPNYHNLELQLSGNIIKDIHQSVILNNQLLVEIPSDRSNNLNCESENYLLSHARDCVDNQNYACALGNYFLLSEIFDHEPKYRLEFADWLLSINARELAKREYLQVLDQSPDNWQVQEILHQLRRVPILQEL